MKGQGGHDIFTHNPNGDLRGFKSQKDEHCEEMPLTHSGSRQEISSQLIIRKSELPQRPSQEALLL